MNTFKFLAFGFAMSTQFAFAEGIATDGTMGAAQTLTGANVTIPQTLGTTVGNNLFHSFADFNINTGQIATFIGGDNLQNVISRVTGGNGSSIDGVLKSDIKNADFYFINPNGITFGANAQVDVPAAFHVSTADKMDFGKNGGVFYANLNKDSKLSSDAPAAFGFLGTSKATNGLIDFNGAKVTFKEGQMLDVVAGQITMKGEGQKFSADGTPLDPKNIKIPAGEIRLVAMQGEGNATLEKSIEGTLPLPNVVPTATNAGNISINGSTIDANGDGAGKIAVYGGETTMSDSSLSANNTGTKDVTMAKGVDVQIESLSLKDNSRIRTNAEENGKGADIAITVTDKFDVTDSTIRSSSSGGHGGNIKVNAKSLTLNTSAEDREAAINANSNSDKDAGSVNLIITEQLTLGNQAYISSDAYGAGNAGAVNVTSNNVELNSKAEIESRAGSTGNTGNVTVESTGLLKMVDGSAIKSKTYDGSTGDTGNISVKAGAITMDSDSWIYTIGMGTGKTGDVMVESSGELNMANGAEISNNTFVLGGGNVTVKAGEVNMDNKAQISSLYAGDVTVNSTGSLNVSSGSAIHNFADMGKMTVTVASMNLDAKGGSMTGIDAKGGNIKVKSSGSLDIVNGAIISTISENGDAGDITVNTGSLKIDAQTNKKGFTGIYSSPSLFGTTGKTGNIIVESDDTMNLLNGGVIFNGTSNESDAGNVTVKAGNLKIEGTDNPDNGLTGIYSDTVSSGKSGTVNVESRGDLSILHGGVIDTSSYGVGKAGNVTVTAKTLQIDGLRFRLGFPEPSGIFSKPLDVNKTGRGGQTGDINITAYESVRLSNFGEINMGNDVVVRTPDSIQLTNITVTAPSIDIKNGKITSQSTGNVAAGNIAVNFTNRLNMDNSLITTEANTGDGGAIKIDGGELIYLKNSGFKTTVSGENGNGGDISAKAEMLIMDTGLIQANAKSGNGGNIDLDLQALIPSADTLIKGGKTVEWNSSPSTINVIQAASQTGVSGTVTNSAPQLNLSGVLANVGNSNFDNNLINQDYCAIGQGSSLARKGKGGLPLRAKDLQVK